MGFKKLLGAVAPIAGAAIGFATGGPAGAALGLGLGGAAGGLVAGQPSQQGSGLSGIDPAAYQPLTPDQLNQYLGLLYPAPPAIGSPTSETVTPAATPETVTPAPAAPLSGTMRGQAVQAIYANRNLPPPTAADLAYWSAPEQGSLQDIEANIARAAPSISPEQQAQAWAAYQAGGGDPRGGGPANIYSDQMFQGDELTESGRQALSFMGYGGSPGLAGYTGGGGIGGAPSISAPQISGGTPAFNIAGGTLSKTNTFVQNEFARRFPEQLAALDELRAQVAPNVSLARQAALGQVRDQARQAQGNLRQQISRRGLAGSSFAQSAEGQLSAEYAKQAAQVEVQAAQQELDLTTKFIDMQRGLMAEALARDLTELQIGADLAIAGGRLAADIANIQATLAAAELQARTQLNVANISSEASRFGALTAADASRFASISGLISQGIASDASRFGAEIGARGDIIRAGIGANSAALDASTRAAIANREISSQEAAGRASLFGNLAGLGLGAFFNSRNNTGQFINSGASTSGFPNLNFGLGFG